MAIPQINGQFIYIPYERLSDLSNALSKLISTNELTIEELVKFNNIPSETDLNKAYGISVLNNTLLKPPSLNYLEKISSQNRNPLIDETGDAIATNQVPSQMFRKIFPVNDLVYPNKLTNSFPENYKVEENQQLMSMINSEANSNIISLPEIITKKVADKRDQKRVITTESKSFVQEIDEENKEEREHIQSSIITSISTSTKTSLLTTTSASILLPTPATNRNEIILNAQRYKLIEAEAQSSSLEFNNIQSIIQSVRPKLKSAVTEVFNIEKTPISIKKINTLYVQTPKNYSYESLTNNPIKESLVQSQTFSQINENIRKQLNLEKTAKADSFIVNNGAHNYTNNNYRVSNSTYNDEKLLLTEVNHHFSASNELRQKEVCF